MLQQTLRPILLVMPPTMQPMLPISRGMSPHIQGKMQELNILWSRLIVMKEANVTA
jgi:hypothetical protein